jgi:hypothetical protein
MPVMEMRLELERRVERKEDFLGRRIGSDI